MMLIKRKNNVTMINFSYLLLCHPVAAVKCEYHIIVTLVMKYHDLFENIKLGYHEYLLELHREADFSLHRLPFHHLFLLLHFQRMLHFQLAYYQLHFVHLLQTSLHSLNHPVFHQASFVEAPNF